MAVGVDADEGLEQRGGELEGEGDEADLAVVEREGLLEQRIDRRQQRLDRVVEKVRDAEADQHRECGRPGAMVGHTAALSRRVHASSSGEWVAPRDRGGAKLCTQIGRPATSESTWETRRAASSGNGQARRLGEGDGLAGGAAQGGAGLESVGVTRDRCRRWASWPCPACGCLRRPGAICRPCGAVPLPRCRASRRSPP